MRRGAGRGSGRGGGAGRGRGQGPGRMSEMAAGPGGDCVCPACGHREPHVAGQTCTEKQCPKCGVRMIRE